MIYYSKNEKLSIRNIKEADIEMIRMWRNQNNIKQYFINTDTITKQQKNGLLIM